MRACGNYYSCTSAKIYSTNHATSLPLYMFPRPPGGDGTPDLQRPHFVAVHLISNKLTLLWLKESLRRNFECPETVQPDPPTTLFPERKPSLGSLKCPLDRCPMLTRDLNGENILVCDLAPVRKLLKLVVDARSDVTNEDIIIVQYGLILEANIYNVCYGRQASSIHPSVSAFWRTRDSKP
jgi:hypothetical protein